MLDWKVDVNVQLLSISFQYPSWYSYAAKAVYPAAYSYPYAAAAPAYTYPAAYSAYPYSYGYKVRKIAEFY